jgi:hypothetical protein
MISRHGFSTAHPPYRNASITTFSAPHVFCLKLRSRMRTGSMGGMNANASWDPMYCRHKLDLAFSLLA